MSISPNPMAVAWSVWRSLRTVLPPRPTGGDAWDHGLLEEPLRRLHIDGPGILPDLADPIKAYLSEAATVAPDRLSRDEALALWINLYNAGALLMAGRALQDGHDSVLRIPGAFRRPLLTIGGEDLSLDDIEHAKLRRLGDPRIHAGIVCGSVSCPTLRHEPYRGGDVDAQLDDQMRRVLVAGALGIDHEAGVVELSRIFLWYGADFVRPHAMPTFLPVRSQRVLTSLLHWVDPDRSEWIRAHRPRVRFQSYDWSLSCRVG
jgi:hypothetical protein